MRHGRAVMPFGKWKGVEVRMLPHDYLSWLLSSEILKKSEWRWLAHSVIAEGRHRGFNVEALESLSFEHYEETLAFADGRTKIFRLSKITVPESVKITLNGMNTAIGQYSLELHGAQLCVVFMDCPPAGTIIRAAYLGRPGYVEVAPILIETKELTTPRARRSNRERKI